MKRRVFMGACGLMLPASLLAPVSAVRSAVVLLRVGPEDSGFAGTLFHVPASPGSVTIQVYPTESVAASPTATRIGFGIPFPRGLVSNVTGVHLRNSGGTEVESAIYQTTQWRSLSGSAESWVGSVRSALMYTDIVFPNDTDPVQFSVHWGVTRTEEMSSPPTVAQVKTLWRTVPSSYTNTQYPKRITSPRFDNEYPSNDSVSEPKAYAQFDAEYLGWCLLRTRTSPDYNNATYNWLDDGVINFGKTAVNEVEPEIDNDESHMVDYVDNVGNSGDDVGAPPWLFDRALTFFSVYARTGDVRWIQHGHRAAQFYAKHINSDGYFELKGAFNDFKYSYGHSMLVDYMLTGDSSLLSKIEDVANCPGLLGWNETYYDGYNGWNERIQSYAILGTLASWEATGSSTRKDRCDEIVNATINMCTNKANENWPDDYAPLHDIADHEQWLGHPDAGTGIISPWMCCLLTDAVWRYYLHSESTDALTFISGVADSIRLYCLRTVNLSGTDVRTPDYLASSYYSTEQWGDWEHSPEMAALMFRGAWARKKLGGDESALLAEAETLLDAWEWVFNYWYRPGSHEAPNYLPQWRVSPPRKYSWWVGTSTDWEWLRTEVS